MRCMQSGLNRAVAVSGFICFLVISLMSARGTASYQGYVKQITSIKIVEQADRISMIIHADQLLTYTSVKKAVPLSLILYFSQTALAASENIFVPPNGIIQMARASSFSTKKGAASRIDIILKKDAFYEITRQGEGIKISFNKTVAEIGSAVKRTSYDSSHSSDKIPQNERQATKLHSIYAARFGNSLKVFVGADGMITNYKTFVIENPARIVYDLFNIESPYQYEKIIPVNTQWVNKIRYFNYPDRVRVILETQKQFLADYSGHPTENGLLIQMGERPADEAMGKQINTASAQKETAPEYSERLTSVYASQLKDGVLVRVQGDGPIENFKTSVIENPPQIIVDIYDITSPYENEQSFPVDSQWVKAVRHQRYPDKVRVTIETRTPYLNAYTATPDAYGLAIQVGGVEVQAGDTVPSDPSMPAEEKTDGGGIAQIDQINFSGEISGKSILYIGTTRPVSYDANKIDDLNLYIKIFNSRLPKQHRRPMITDRFESAVDSIMPKQDTSDNDTVLFDIHLREAVPYFIEQEGSLLKVHFEASSVSPKPMTGVASAKESISGQLLEAEPDTTSAENTAPVPQAAGSVSAVSPPLDEIKADSSAPPSSLPGEMKTEDFDLDLGDELQLSDNEPKYTGEKIALDFFETDIKNVFRILREVSGKNFAIDKDVTGKVTLTLGQPVPWDQVLDLVLKMNQLGKTVEGDIIRIATQKTLAAEEKMKQDKREAELTFKEQQKELEPLVTEYLPVNYSKAKAEIQPHIEAILTKDRGSVSVDERTNMVIMTDTADKIKKAKELIRKLDRVTPQVIIEARVVEATTSFQKEIGTQWQMGVGVQEVGTGAEQPGNADSQVVNIGGLTNEVSTSVNDRVGVGSERGYNELGGTYGYNMAMDFPIAASQFGSIGFNFMRIAGTPLLLNAKLMAMESQGEAKIISAPKVVTLDNKKAVIKQGISYPYQTVEDGEVNISFKDVDLLLEVTPHVTPDNRISMSINITKNDLGEVISGQQSFTTKEAQTELLINDGDTVVIGGIIKTTKKSDMSGIPGLSKIPIIGWLFKTEGRDEQKEELLIFITPRIVQLEQRTVLF